MNKMAPEKLGPTPWAGPELDTLTVVCRPRSAVTSCPLGLPPPPCRLSSPGPVLPAHPPPTRLDVGLQRHRGESAFLLAVPCDRGSSLQHSLGRTFPPGSRLPHTLGAHCHEPRVRTLSPWPGHGAPHTRIVQPWPRPGEAQQPRVAVRWGRGSGR